MSKKQSAKRAQQQAKRQAKRRQKQQKKAFFTILTVVIIAAVIYGAVELLRQQDEARAGTKVPTQAAGHIPACTPTYTTTPPTSGCHRPNWDSWGTHSTPIANEIQVHNLEHGGVILQYRPNPVPGLSDAYIDEVTSLVNELRQDRRFCKLILAPYPGLEPTIALTAWGWMLTLEEFDEDLIKQFIDDHIGRNGPEFSAPCS